MFTLSRVARFASGIFVLRSPPTREPEKRTKTTRRAHETRYRVCGDNSVPGKIDAKEARRRHKRIGARTCAGDGLDITVPRYLYVRAL